MGHTHTQTHTHTEKRVQSKPHSSSVQWHSSHSKRTLLINSIRSHRQRERLMERYSAVALAPHHYPLPPLLCSWLFLPSPFLVSQSLGPFHPTLSLPLSGPGQAALKKSKVPPPPPKKKKMQQKKIKSNQMNENQRATHCEPPLFLYFSCFLICHFLSSSPL